MPHFLVLWAGRVPKIFLSLMSDVLIRMCQDCQVAGWNKNGHKADCKLLKDEDLRSLFTNDWDKFESGIQFPLSK